MALAEQKPVLLLIDVQMGFQDPVFWGGERNNPGAEAACGALLKRWRALGLPILHVRHSSDNPASKLHAGDPGFAFHPAARPLPGEPVVTKNVNSAFIGTDLSDKLAELGATTLVVAGLTTDHCVSTTTRMAGNLGFEVFLVSDAAATFDRTGPDGRRFDAELVHAAALASLHGEFATVLSSEDLFSAL